MYEQTSTYVTDWLHKRAKLTPNRVGLTDLESGRDVSYEAWNERANRTANFLSDIGVGKGDLVSVYASNRPEYLDLLFACGKIGAILHNLNWRLTRRELADLLADVEPAVFVYSGDWAEQTEALQSELPDSCRLVAMDEGVGPARISLEERNACDSALRVRPEMDMDDPWGIYYTGGTTGLPKGAVLTHGNMTWNSVNTISSWGLTADHVAPLQLPLFHIGGPNIFMLPLVHVGGQTILCREFDPEDTFDLIDDGRVTHYVAVPTMYALLQQHERWDATDFSELELVISGGAPCPEPIMEKFWAKGVDFKMGYGLTEAAGNNFWLPPGDVREKPDSVGVPLFHVDVDVVAEDGSSCGVGETGELCIRGPHITPGYWKKPEATEETIREGWLHTGDVAERDEDGYYYIRGRLKEMFISGGENVYPAEVESVMHAHPAVEEAALIAIPHQTWGEVGHAFVALEDGCTLTQSDMLDFMSDQLAKYKRPKGITFVDELPKTAIGKIDKKKLEAEVE